MREVLEKLGAYPGIVGSLVATTDGMVVASHLNGMDEDAAAALVSPGSGAGHTSRSPPPTSLVAVPSACVRAIGTPRRAR